MESPSYNPEKYNSNIHLNLTAQNQRIKHIVLKTPKYWHRNIDEPPCDTIGYLYS